MSKEFVASNGLKVVERYDGERLYLYDGDGENLMKNWDFIGVRDTVALAEYYRAKEDERLGRWRWPENPDYVVYPIPGPDESVTSVRVFRESTSACGFYYRTDSGENTTENPGHAARAYFDAHPEPKPWHDAKPGEVWLLMFREGTLHDGAYVAGDWSFVAADHAVPKDDPRITSARKIWPQDEPTIDDLSNDA